MTLTVLPFIPKDDQEMPNAYGLTVTFHGGAPLELELVDHRILPSAVLSYVTAQDTYGFIPLTSIKQVSYDKRYSRMVALHQKRLAEEKAPDDTKSSA